MSEDFEIHYACDNCKGLIFCKCAPRVTHVRVKLDAEGVTERVYVNGHEIPGSFFEFDFRTGLVTLTFRGSVEVSR